MSSFDDSPHTKHGPTGRVAWTDGTSVPVSIGSHGEDLLLLVLDGAEAFAAAPLSLLVLESTGRRGVVRTAGSAELIEANLLRFVLGDSVELVQRREFVRVIAAKRVVLEDAEGTPLAEGRSVDISRGGMLIQLPRSAEVPLDTTVGFSLFLGLTDHDDQVSGAGRIVRRNAGNQIAIGFERMANRDQERLIRFLFDHQRVALRVTRGDTL